MQIKKHLHAGVPKRMIFLLASTQFWQESKAE